MQIIPEEFWMHWGRETREKKYSIVVGARVTGLRATCPHNPSFLRYDHITILTGEFMTSNNKNTVHNPRANKPTVSINNQQIVVISIGSSKSVCRVVGCIVVKVWSKKVHTDPSALLSQVLHFALCLKVMWSFYSRKYRPSRTHPCTLLWY